MTQCQHARMTEYEPLYCSECATDALEQHLAKKNDLNEVPIKLEPASREGGLWHQVAEDLGDGVYRIPRAEVVFRGASLCLVHMAGAMVER